jgi:exodeoxyribonuclease VII small subunit
MELDRLTTISPFQRSMTTDTSSGQPASAPASYEVALSELEALVASMEAGQLPLEGLLASYRRGTELLQYCRSRLEAVEQQVKVLEGGQLKAWPQT